MAAVTLKGNYSVRSFFNSDAKEALMTACSTGDLEGAVDAIYRGGDLEFQDSDGSTPLYEACYRGHFHILELLIKRGVDVNRPAVNGFTALHAACRKGRLEFVQLLLDQGADIDASENDDEVTPLQMAVYSCHLDVARFLIEKGADVNSQDRNGRTALQGAAIRNDRQLMWLLRESGAVVSKDFFGDTPRDFCLAGIKPENVRYLLNNARV